MLKSVSDRKIDKERVKERLFSVDSILTKDPLLLEGW